MKNKLLRPICPQCGSRDIRARISTKEHWCRRCGYEGRKEEFYEESDENN